MTYQSLPFRFLIWETQTVVPAFYGPGIQYKLALFLLRVSSRHQRVSSQIYYIIYLDTVQEHLTEGLREWPKGKEADRERGVWPYMEKVSRNPGERDGQSSQCSSARETLEVPRVSGLCLGVHTGGALSKVGARPRGTSVVEATSSFASGV